MRWAATLFCGFVAWGALPEAARAWCQMTTENVAPVPGEPCPTEGIPLQWERPCVSYALDGRGSADLPFDVVHDEISQSFGTWAAADCGDGSSADLETRQLAESAMCREAEFNQDDGNVNVIAFVDDWSERELPPTAFALTTVWHDTSSGEILDVDILVNEELGPYAVCPPEGCTAPGASRPSVDLRNVITHEAGHFFGLAHTDLDLASLPLEEWPTMAPSAQAGDTFMRHLAQDDVDGFCSIYPPSSMMGECEFEPIGGLALDCEADDGGGRCMVTGAPGAGGSSSGPAAALALGLLALTLARARRARG